QGLELRAGLPSSGEPPCNPSASYEPLGLRELQPDFQPLASLCSELDAGYTCFGSEVSSCKEDAVEAWMGHHGAVWPDCHGTAELARPYYWRNLEPIDELGRIPRSTRRCPSR